MDFRVRLPGAVYRQARDRAGDDTALEQLIVAHVTAYAAGQTAQQRGGQARAQQMSRAERSASAKAAAIARWAKPTPDAL